EVLRTRGAGRAQFLPLESVRHVYPLNLQKERGVVGVAAKMVRCDALYRPLVDTLLGRVIICEDAATGLKMIRRGLGAVVTLDGTLIEQTGVITGGATGVTETLFSRQREMEELPGRIQELRERTGVADHQLENARAAIGQMAERSRESEAAYGQLRREGETSRVEVDRRRQALHRLRRELTMNRAKRVDVQRERLSSERLIAQASQAIAQATARSAEREAGLGGIEEQLKEATERRDATLRSVAEASGRLASVEGEGKVLGAMREQHEQALERLANQIAARKLQARNLELEAKVLDERLGKLAAELETILGQRSQQSDDAAPDRDELHRLENHERTVQDEFQAAQGALLEVDRRRLDVEAEVARALDHLESLRAEMEREGLAPNRRGEIVGIDEAMDSEPLFGGQASGVPPAQGGAIIDVEATRGQIEELRRQIRRLGPINEEAPGDYDESRERFEFLTTQLRDLDEAETQLRDAIAALNEEVRTRFAETFERVNTSFGEYFSAFFGGGSASLMLSDPENVAESGVEVEAQPPGKRINSLTLLSGGERSLTAVALLFALLTANPAPFCVLDEVDAALDEANVGRFTDALRKLAEGTQFLVVTHNRRTIEIADDIFGVSMGPDGVSKVLSLRLADIPQN
ncbi:MAG: AAA family ATPase, partial [Dehalococcoidia bacterium]